MYSREIIQKLLSENSLDEALRQLDSHLSETPDDADALFLRGKTRWRLGDRAGATTDYAGAAALCPDGPAARALELARDVEAFYNTDLYNP